MAVWWREGTGVFPGAGEGEVAWDAGRQTWFGLFYPTPTRSAILDDDTNITSTNTVAVTMTFPRALPFLLPPSTPPASPESRRSGAALCSPSLGLHPLPETQPPIEPSGP